MKTDNIIDTDFILTTPLEYLAPEELYERVKKEVEEEVDFDKVREDFAKKVLSESTLELFNIGK